MRGRAKWRSDPELLDRPAAPVTQEELDAIERQADEHVMEVLTRTRLVGESIGDGCVNDTGEDY